MDRRAECRDVCVSRAAAHPSAQIRRRLPELWNYERYGVPSREDRWYVFARNDGLQNQAVLRKATWLGGVPDVLIDPNLLSTDAP